VLMGQHAAGSHQVQYAANKELEAEEVEILTHASVPTFSVEIRGFLHPEGKHHANLQHSKSP
jgi:hypothetical protein